MLYFLGHKTYADAISNAIRKTIVEDRIHTPGSYPVDHYSHHLTLFSSYKIQWKCWLMPLYCNLFRFRLGRQQHINRRHPKYPCTSRWRRHPLVNIALQCATIPLSSPSSKLLALKLLCLYLLLSELSFGSPHFIPFTSLQYTIISNCKIFINFSLSSFFFLNIRYFVLLFPYVMCLCENEKKNNNH